jgi:hypothetical protein
MFADTTAASGRDVFIGRREWLATRATECSIEDEEGAFLCHARVADTICRSPLIIMAREDGTQNLLRIQRPACNFRLESGHEAVPGTDNVYHVTDLMSNLEIGIVQKPWLKGVWRDLWIVRDAGWIEICRIQQSSPWRALLRTFVISPLPSRTTKHVASGRCAVPGTLPVLKSPPICGKISRAHSIAASPSPSWSFCLPAESLPTAQFN